MTNCSCDTFTTNVTVNGPGTGEALVITNSNSNGIHANATGSVSAIWGDNSTGAGNGVCGSNNSYGCGVAGCNNSTGIGVYGVSTSGDGGYFVGSVRGCYGRNTTASGSCAILAFAANGPKGIISQGDVQVIGTLTKSAGSFMIDHPLDPANKFLTHSFVESPDMKNIYDGVGVADANGNLKISMPSYFSALNEDFRYQLTAIGKAAPNLHVSKELAQNSFTVSGANAGQKVSWQTTGIRKDKYAVANPMIVEKDKEHKGFYLHPELEGHSDEKAWHQTVSVSKEPGNLPTK